MNSTPPDADDLIFIPDPEPSTDPAGLRWKVLIVDDEPDVHEVTIVALKEIVIEGRCLEFVRAYSAEEAKVRLAEHPDLAVILLDVVMESDDAGLRLIRHIREHLKNEAIRIILRTGQPGYAPELDTIRAYDINDYKTKAELTRVRLFTSMTVAIRSYWQIHQLEVNRRGLELIVEGSTELSKPSGLSRFAAGVVTQLCSLLGVHEEGIVCAASEISNTSPYILAAAGKYSEWIGHTLDAVTEERVRKELLKSLTERRHFFGETTCLFFNVPGDHSLAAFVDVNHRLNEVDHKLLEVFCSNIAVAFENTQLYQRISTLAFEDPLLKLPNRNSFLVRIDLRPDTCDRLALVDIDDFPDINSILDQDFGDAVLSVVAKRLRQSFSPEVLIARVGSDVFGLLGSQTEVTAERIAEVFANTFEMSGERLRLSATTGLVKLDQTPAKAVELLKNAGVALKQAKTLNRGKAIFFEKAHAMEARNRMQMLSQLRKAFSAERLFLVYQPFVNLASGRIIGAEALLRWRTEQGEFVSPDCFIPLAEQSGLMVPIGDWVMQSALQFLKRLNQQGHQTFRMAINVSHIQFREPDFVDKLLAAIHDSQTMPHDVEIELTESVAIDNIDLIEQKLSAIRAAGISIALDDFGTGYSSLNVIRKLDISRLKIDRAFVSGEDCINGDYSIAELVLKLAGQLGLETIAEGIETPAQQEKLLSLGCLDGQGYLFSKPLECAAFERLLEKTQKTA